MSLGLNLHHGGRRGVKISDCFPFPDPTTEQKQQVRELGVWLDAHPGRYPELPEELR